MIPRSRRSSRHCRTFRSRPVDHVRLKETEGMPRVSAAFFVTGALFLAGGMIWGMYMGAHEDFALATAHAHLNLLGWVTAALYGTFYALTRETMSVRLAWLNYVLSTVGVLVMIPALSMQLTTNDLAKWSPVVATGSGIVFLGLLTFVISAVREVFRRR